MEYFGSDTTFNLFVNNPVILSLSFLLLIITTPFFAVLASYGQFCSDLKNGFFRFLIVRCHRIEIFIARFLSASLLITSTFLIVVVIAALLSMKQGDFSNPDIFSYSVRIFLTLLLYTLPFVAFVSFLSALIKSELGVIFLGMTASGITYLFFISSLATQQSSNVAHFLPIGIMNNILALQSEFFWKSIALLPIYFLVYTALAYYVFHRRNL
jgi:ABC-type transport system involved in multi-copper enzyme maturation permease subunit